MWSRYGGRRKRREFPSLSLPRRLQADRPRFSSWRDCHEDWKEIKERLAAEEEAKRRLEEEEEALGGPALSVSIEEGEEKSAEHQKGVVEAQDLAKALASVKI